MNVAYLRMPRLLAPRLFGSLTLIVLIGPSLGLCQLPAPVPADAVGKPPIMVESIMVRDPVIELTIERRQFPPQLLDIWQEALARPEADLRREAAETIAKAHRRGMTGLSESAPALLKLLGDKDEHETVRLAAARTLIAIDARQAADALFAQSQSGGLPLAQLIEPALAKWGHAAARKAWHTRLTDDAAPRSRRRLAIECLTVAGEASAAPSLLEIVRDANAPADLRLSAARAAGLLSQPAPLDDAKRFIGEAASASNGDQLLGVHLLAQASGDEVETLLERLALGDEPAVAALAWRRLLDVDPDRAVVIAPQSLANRDANVRRLAAEALVVRPTAARVTLLCPLLDDPHPKVRAYVRDSLFSLAADNPEECKAPAIAGAVAVLDAADSERWRGHEQAALLLAALDHKPAAARLVELLEAPRHEEFVTAAWALRILAVPETFPAMLDRATRKTKDTIEGQFDRQVAQIFQAFGQHKYSAGEPLMRTFVPKDPMIGLTSRTAAVWAIGHLHAGKPDMELVQEFVSRMNDIQGPLPEMTPVRGMSAISLGRMQAKTEIETLRKYKNMDGSGSYVGFSCCWALRELTGEPIDPRPVRDKVYSDWFLQPIGR